MCTVLILPWRLREKGHGFKVHLGYTVNSRSALEYEVALCLKKICLRIYNVFMISFKK